MAELITMTPKELSRYEIIKRLIQKTINGTEAAKQVCLSVRQVRRLKAGVKKYGARGIIHGQRGKPGNRRMPEEKIEKIEKLVKENYHDFGPTFAAEKLEEEHQLRISKEKLRQLMIGWKWWGPKPRKKNKEYRSWRPRKEYYGEMEQFDGCYYDWFEERAERHCLLASIDDASGKITGARLVPDEGVISVYTFWKNYVQNHGKPLKIYLDRLSTYKNTHKSVFDDPVVLTQFQRAMKDLDIEDISAYSPQAKGRIERLFPTLQDRLVKEMRLSKISTIEEANKFLEETFIPKFNAKFAVMTQRKGNLHRELSVVDRANLDKIFSIQNQRIVNNDFTIRFKGKWFQLSETQPTLVLKKSKVQIEERIDGQIFISLRNKYLNCKILPVRPEKIKVPIVALTRTRSAWKPPANHPWRTPFLIPKRETNQTAFIN